MKIAQLTIKNSYLRDVKPRQIMYRFRKIITLIAVVSATSSCVSLRKYTELAGDKHYADSVNTSRIGLLEEQLREVSCARVELLQDTLRLSRQIAELRQDYERLLHGNNSENAIATRRLQESRARLNERTRRMEEQSSMLGLTQDKLVKAEQRLAAREAQIAEQEKQLQEHRARLRAAIDSIKNMTRLLDDYKRAAAELSLARSSKDSLATEAALDKILDLAR